jgi:glycosyltransferase involved in cell wall biosynthesis
MGKSKFISMNLSIVVSVYNEDEVLKAFFMQLEDALSYIDGVKEIIFVNDGSSDCSLSQLLSFKSSLNKIKVINFSRNFGHEAAMLAGIDYSCGEAVVCLDADLQHPPEIIKKMYGKYSEGYDVINMVRIANHGSTITKKLTSKFFYWFFNKVSSVKLEENASDFFLISQKVANILKTDYRERNRYLRGFIQIIGFKKTTIEFIAPQRAAGNSKYSILALFTLSIHSIFSFSHLPLRLGVIASGVVGCFALGVTLYSVVMKFLGYAPSGYTTIVVLISLLFSIQFFITGMIGEYLGLIFAENKKRPIYLVDFVKESAVDDS